ncbi:nitrous oxide reductase accessory protein NosL [Halopiger aswanensis]|uniref:Nitrous oxide reductase accessory protein NosL n=1 Tax=Halopiger aswanensis TaxID=148449 RepID=A0A3R7GFP0_9EURY|nr:nitrous oxide reductase accessory protein NosL [Halopiger aswanensis]RKD88976.1 nitrous oxide reductase accessory protein NosL [Halopiger aswanensis]
MDPHENSRTRRLNSGPTRRAALIGAALTGLGTLAGCLGGGSGGGESMSDPITIESEMQCDNCTMTIGDYPGPAGQSFYEDAAAVLGSGSAGGEGDDQDRPAQFCSSRCTYNFTFENESEQEPEVSYLTDYSAVDYEIDTGGDEPEISRHLDADGFAPATDLTFVVDSEVRGAMGASLIGFSDGDDADSFQEEYGGDRYEHDEINRELIQSLMN